MKKICLYEIASKKRRKTNEIYSREIIYDKSTKKKNWVKQEYKQGIWLPVNVYLKSKNPVYFPLMVI